MQIDFHDPASALNSDLPYFDVYARPEYGSSAELIDGGRWQCAASGTSEIAFSYIQRRIPGTDYFDIVTPYGYGGFSYRPGTSFSALCEFRTALLDALRETGVVAEFLRLSPLDNHEAVLEQAGRTFTRSTFGGTIDSYDSYFASVDSRHRRSVRKAISLGLEVSAENPDDLVHPECNFRQIYDQTMERLDARDSLRLTNDYYRRLLELPIGSLRLLTATLRGEPVASALFIVAQSRLHYHLSGATESGRTSRATNFLIDRAVAQDPRSRFTIHLGGGLAEGDSLERFKRLATPQRYNMTYAQTVVNDEVYRALTKNSPTTDYFPAYRAPKGL